MPRTYFHLAPVPLRPDSVIEAGNWGRVIKRYRPAMDHRQAVGDPWLLSRELIFEQVRVAVRPDAPSRLSAAFVIEEEAAARRYREANDPDHLRIMHRVQIVDEDLARHEGSLSCFTLQVSPFLDPQRMFAHTYWRGEGGGDHEIVTASALRVVERLGW